MQMSPEDTIIVCCVKRDVDEYAIYKVKEALKSEPDWRYIVEKAHRHGVSSLLYRNLMEIRKFIEEEPGVPEEIIARLRRIYNGIIARSIFFYNELRRILENFKQEGIETAVLKGAALAETVYRDMGLRPFSDVDLLIHRDDLEKAKRKMAEMGYVLDENVTPQKYNEKFGCDLYYVGRIILEIHWDIARKIGSDKYTRIDIKRLWERMIPAKVAGVDTLVLSPEDTLLHLCVHLQRHRYNRLIWLCDICEIIRQNEIDWKYVLETAEKYRTRKYMYYGLLFTKKIIGGCDIPSEVMKRLRPPHLEAALFERVFLKEILSDEGKILPIFNLLKTLLIDRMQDRMKYLCEYIFPPVEALARMYSVPQRKAFFYYVIHPLNLWFETSKRLMTIIGLRNRK